VCVCVYAVSYQSVSGRLEGPAESLMGPCTVRWMSSNLYEAGAPAVSGLDRSVVDSVSSEEPWALVERFADLERVSGTADERAAASYLTDRLAAHGIDHETHEPELYLSTPQGASVEADDGWRSETAKTVAFAADATVSGELVYSENDEEADGLEAMLSVSLDGLPEDLSSTVVTSESIIPISAIDELAERGAEGFLGIHPHEREPHHGIVTPVWGGAPPYDGRDRRPALPVANVSKREGRELIERAGTGATVTLDCSTDTGWVACPLVHARIPGEAAPDSDEFVLLHGHLDSWDVGVTDNATGDAALLEAARVLAAHSDQLRRDVWVAWWPGHSTGRYAGSTWFADEFADALAERCLAHVNVDSPGVAGATEFRDRVKWTAAVHDVAADAIGDVTGKPTEKHRPPRAGDYSFNNLGIPGMSLQSGIPESVREERGYHPVGGSGGHADAWHLSTDTLDKADRDVLVRDTQVYTLATARLATEPAPLDAPATVEHHRELLRAYDGTGGFDLSPVLAELDALERALEGADREAAVEAVRALTRLNLASEGRFEQDPAVSRPPYPRLAPVERLPALSGDEERFLRLQLERARTAVVADLRAARRALQN